MLDYVLESSKVSFDGREPGDIFVYMQEVDLILSHFLDGDPSVQGRRRTTIAGMKPSARDTGTTNVQVGNVSHILYATFSHSIFDMYMKTATVIETKIRIWNLSQKSTENATTWGARCLQAMMYPIKKDVTYCSRHQEFMAAQEIGIEEKKLTNEYQHTNYTTQVYLEVTMLYLRGR